MNVNFQAKNIDKQYWTNFQDYLLRGEISEPWLVTQHFLAIEILAKYFEKLIYLMWNTISVDYIHLILIT